MADRLTQLQEAVNQVLSMTMTSITVSYCDVLVLSWQIISVTA